MNYNYLLLFIYYYFIIIIILTFLKDKVKLITQ